MIVAALTFLLAANDPFAPIDVTKLPTKSVSGGPVTLTRAKWKAQIHIRLEGASPDDPVFVDRWSEVGEVLETSLPKIRFTRTLEASTLDGQSIPPPEGDPLVWEETLGEDAFRSPMLEDPAAHRAARLTAFVFPQAAPIKWPASAESRVPPATTTFVVDLRRAMEFGGRWTRHATWKFAEQPGIRGTGEALYDLETGVMLYGRIEATEVPLSGGDGSLFKLTWVRRAAG